MLAELTVAPSSYDHPDAVLLTGLAQDFYVEMYGGPDDSPMTTEEFASPQGAFFLGYLGDEPVAMGGWRFIPGVGPAEAASPVEIKRMFVRPEARGGGIGRQILRVLEATATTAGADWALLQTGDPQTAAIAFYRSVGYQEVTPFGFFAGMPQAVHLGRRLA